MKNLKFHQLKFFFLVLMQIFCSLQEILAESNENTTEINGYLAAESSNNTVQNTPSGLCPDGYHLTRNLNGAFCQRVYFEPKTWFEANEICRQSMANIASTVAVFEQNLTNPETWWTNWHKKNFSSITNNNSITLLDDNFQNGSSTKYWSSFWYHETVYGRNLNEPIRRATSLNDILIIETKENEIIEKENITVQIVTFGNCAVIKKAKINVIASMNCNIRNAFVCEFNIFNLQQSINSFQRNRNSSQIFGQDTVTYYNSSRLARFQSAAYPSEIQSNLVLGQALFTTAENFPEALKKTYRICDEVFPPALIQSMLDERYRYGWETTLVESPHGRMCYLKPTTNFSGVVPVMNDVNYNSTQDNYCRPLKATAVRSLTFGQQFYSRYIWPDRNGYSFVSRWVDATQDLKTESELFTPGSTTTSAYPPWSSTRASTVNQNIGSWRWSDGKIIPREIVSWIKARNGEMSQSSCVVERTYQQSQMPTEEFGSDSVPWYTSSCDQLATPVCQKELPTLSKPSSNFSGKVTLRFLNSVEAVAADFLTGSTDMPLVECETDQGSLMNLRSVWFFGPTSSSAEAGTAIFAPFRTLQTVRYVHDAVEEAKSVLKLSCFLNSSNVGCKSLMEYFKSPPNAEFYFVGRWSTMVKLSGYYHCTMLLRETLQWHHSAPVLMKDNQLRFAFQLNATFSERVSESTSQLFDYLTENITRAFEVWQKLQLQAGVGHPAQEGIILHVQARQSLADSRYVLGGHVVFHLVPAEILTGRSGSLRNEEPFESSVNKNSAINGTRMVGQRQAGRPLAIFKKFSRNEKNQLRRFVADVLAEKSFFANLTEIYDKENDISSENRTDADPGENQWLFKATDGCLAADKLIGNHTFHWMYVSAYQPSDSPLEFCPDRNFRRLCVGDFKEGYSSLFPSSPCSISPPPLSSISSLISSFLSNPVLTPEAFQNVADNLLTSLKSSNFTKNLTVTDLSYLGAFFQLIDESLTAIPQDLFRILVNLTGEISHAPVDQLQTAQSYTGTSNRIIIALEGLANSVELGFGNNLSFSVNVPNLAVDSFRVPDNVQVTSGSIVGFAAVTNSRVVSGISSSDKNTALNEETAVSIILPDNLVNELYKISANLSGGLRGHYLVFRETALLSIPAQSPEKPQNGVNNGGKSTSQRFLGIASWIIGASFDIDIPLLLNLPEPISFTAKINNYNAKQKYSCAFWNITAMYGQGSWDTRGCYKASFSNDHAICKCNHLTSFAVLLDFHIGPDDPPLPPFLDMLTTIALALSIIGLTATILLLLLSRRMIKSHRKTFTKNEFVVFNLSLALLLAYVTFLAGIDKTANRNECITAGVFIHYFFLVAFAWQAVESVLLYSTFVVNVTTYRLTYFRAKAAAVSWGIPLVIVAVVLIIGSDLYLGKNVCWLGASGNPAAFYSAFVAPVCLILFSNFFIFVLVTRELSCAKKLEVRSTKNKDDLSTQFRRCISLFFLLGLPWLLLTLNVTSSTSDGRIALHVLIIIFCGTQGLAIFAIEVYGMRKELKEILPFYSKAPSSTDVSLVAASWKSKSESSGSFEMNEKKRF